MAMDEEYEDDSTIYVTPDNSAPVYNEPDQVTYFEARHSGYDPKGAALVAAAMIMDELAFNRSVGNLLDEEEFINEPPETQEAEKVEEFLAGYARGGWGHLEIDLPGSVHSDIHLLKPNASLVVDAAEVLSEVEASIADAKLWHNDIEHMRVVTTKYGAELPTVTYRGVTFIAGPDGKRMGLGFEKIEAINNDGMICSTSGRMYAVTTADERAAVSAQLQIPEKGEVLAYPLFLHSPELLVTRIGGEKPRLDPDWLTSYLSYLRNGGMPPEFGRLEKSESGLDF
jgi:hypothetical protein